MVKIPMARTGADAKAQALNKPLSVNLEHYQWTCVEKPKVNASLLLTQEGLNVTFTVYESSPLTTALVQQEPMLMVCQDSAVEVFLAFSDKQHDPDFKPQLEHCMYTNIEINSKGICYAKYGHSRKNRTAFTKDEIASLQIKTEVLADHWTCNLTVPRSLVRKIAGYDALSEIFAINLYKISETKSHEHYVSFNPIGVEQPNFHLPEFFALAQSTNA